LLEIVLLLQKNNRVFNIIVSKIAISKYCLKIEILKD